MFHLYQKTEILVLDKFCIEKFRVLRNFHDVQGLYSNKNMNPLQNLSA